LTINQQQINIGMRNQSPISPDKSRWIVDFTLRIDNDDQRRVVETLGISQVHAIVRLWLTVLAPGASVLDPPDKPIRRIGFPNRASARRFRATWGGRIVTPTSDLKPPLGPV
jgi:hypothetical protein